MGDVEFQEIAHHGFDLLDAGVTELQHPATIHANEVVVLFVAVRLFVLGQVLAKLMFLHQITSHEQFEGVVYGGPADPVLLCFHVDVQGFGIEMIRPFIYFLQDGEALRRFPKAVLLQMRSKNILDFLDYFLLCSSRRHILFLIR